MIPLKQQKVKQLTFILNCHMLMLGGYSV